MSTTQRYFWVMASSFISPVLQGIYGYMDIWQGRRRMVAGWAFQAGAFPTTSCWVQIYFAPGKQWQAHLGWRSDSFELQCDKNFAFMTQRFGAALRPLHAVSSCPLLCSPFSAALTQHASFWGLFICFEKGGFVVQQAWGRSKGEKKCILFSCKVFTRKLCF